MTQSRSRWNLSRRQLLSGVAAGAVANFMPSLTAPALAGTPDYTLKTKLSSVQLLDPGEPKTDVWSYQGLSPGPILRAKQGEPFWVKLQNELSEPTTIHWHGIRIDNAMDGVPDLTQAAVPPGGTFDYRYTPKDAGTYWYHSHYRGYEQVARGLNGVLIVEEREPPMVDQDIVLAFDDWRLKDSGEIHEESFGSLMDRTHAGRLGNILTLNGAPLFDVPVRSGERVRLRLANVATARVLNISFPGHAPKIIALDGQPVAPFDAGKEDLLLGPGQRIDVIMDMISAPGQKTPIQVDTGRETLVAGHIVYKAGAPPKQQVRKSFDGLPANPIPENVNLSQALDVDIVMTGGAMSFFEQAVYRGKNFPARQLAREHGQVWALNGVAGMPKAPLFSAARGRVVRIKMSNKTRWPHAMHFHGHHVREVARSQGTVRPHWRDTVHMEPDEDITVAFIADNPGKWLIHCHMLAHQLGGMITWFEVG